MTDPVAEITRLHDEIEAWFRGTTDDLSPFADALADDFHIVSPGGNTRSEAEIVDSLADARGLHEGASQPFEIRIENATVRVDDGDSWLVTYEEHQRVDGDWEARTSSVLLRERASAPAGIEWVHLHETWLPEGNPAS